MSNTGFSSGPAPTPNSTPAANAPAAPAARKPLRGAIGKTLVVGSVLAGIFMLARSCTQEPVAPQPAPPPAPPPPAARPLQLWETSNSIAAAFDVRGRIYGGVGYNYLQADRVASQACTSNLSRDEQGCFGFQAYQGKEPGKMCVGIGVDHFNLQSRQNPVPARQLVSYATVTAPTAAETRPLLDKACAERPGQCRLTRAIYCNF